MWKKEEILTGKNFLSKFCVWFHQTTIEKCKKNRKKNYNVILLSLLIEQRVFAASVWRAKHILAHLLYVLRSIHFCGFILQEDDKIEGRIKQWWLRIRCNFSCVMCVRVSNAPKPLLSQFGARELRHNRKNRNYLHWNSTSHISMCTQYIKKKIHRQFTERRSRLRFVQMEKDWDVFFFYSRFPSVLTEHAYPYSKCNKKQKNREAK